MTTKTMTINILDHELLKFEFNIDFGLLSDINWPDYEDSYSVGAPKVGLEIPLSRGYFAKITPRNYLKFIFTQSLSITLDARLIYHAIPQFLSSNSRFHALKYIK